MRYEDISYQLSPVYQELMRRPKPKSLQPYNVQEITAFGEPEYGQAYSDWGRMVSDYISKMGGIYQPKSYAGYGAGLRRESLEAVQGGLARDIGQQIATGGTSGWTGGLGTRASSELSKLYKNIRDTQMQLAAQSYAAYNQAYASMMGPLAGLMGAAPTYGQYVQPVTTTRTGYSWV